ncbi:MAG TPA: tRNA lysidine(34) synthetase TilS [Dehalococcoidales bacterium]|nr:tRNA lysidine(34) synthetase TilS [Dehalococcoidales bacterium]
MARPETTVQTVLRFIRQHRLVARGEKLLVAVSGGPDSVCLLHVLTQLRGELGIELHVAHLDHRLRGADGAADAEYVVDLARRLGIPITVASRDVRAYRAQHRVSLEEAAREVRYAFLAEVAQETGTAKAAVGHTADDHIETILMHLIRGSGPRGLRGLLPAGRWPYPGTDLTVVRPLLEISRRETAAYCRRYKLGPHTDTTNLSGEPLRNRIRRQLLPQLKKYNPQVAEALRRMARLAADDLEFIEGEAVMRGEELVKTAGGAVAIDKNGFNALPPALKRHLLRAGIEGLLGSLKDIEAGHIEKVLEALDKPAGKVIGLPDGLTFTIEYDRYVLGADPAALCPFPKLEKEVELKIPGRTVVPGWEIEADIMSTAAAGGGQGGDFTATFDYAKTGEKLTVRRRRPGDRFQPLGLGQAKKLNAFMIDARVPRAWRQRVPVVSAGDRIIWAVGYRIGEPVKVTPQTKKVLVLKFTLKV